MKKINLFIALLTMFAAGSVHAISINFIDMADGVTYGESGYDPLSITKDSVTLDITAEKDGNSAFAYLDASNAGLGVCGNVTNTGPQGESGTNVCLNAAGGPAAGDDNVTTDEVLYFVFSADVIIEEISFNNNHDGGFDGDDLLNLNGDVVAGLPGFSDLGWVVGAGDDFFISFINEQFYISEIVYFRVPEPGVLGLLALGLVVAGFVRRRS